MLSRDDYIEMSKGADSPTQYAILTLRVLLDIRDVLIACREKLDGIERAGWHTESHADRLAKAARGEAT